MPSIVNNCKIRSPMTTPKTSLINTYQSIIEDNKPFLAILLI